MLPEEDDDFQIVSPNNPNKPSPIVVQQEERAIVVGGGTLHIPSDQEIIPPETPSPQKNKTEEDCAFTIAATPFTCFLSMNFFCKKKLTVSLDDRTHQQAPTLAAPARQSMQ